MAKGGQGEVKQKKKSAPVKHRAYPIRSSSHELEAQSVRFFGDHLPKDWTWQKCEPDYGVDLRIDIYDNHRATGLELLVQLKGSMVGCDGKAETVRLRTATYNYLLDKLQIAMLVKFIEADNEAYWLLFRDIPPPSQDTETFSVHIPKLNKLSAIDWSQIQQLVREVTDTKLAAQRRENIARNKAE